MNADLIINNISVLPGERKTILLPMPDLYDCTPISMPVHVLRGKKPGPTLFVSAAIHGDEVNGVEIVRRLVKRSILKKMSGTLIAVPIVNVYGFLYQDRYLMDRRDLNRSFPGSSKGSLGARLAHLISTEIISKVTHCIDLHSGSLQRTNLPQIRADLDMEGVEALARAFAAPVVLHAKLRDGSLRQMANDRNIPFLLYEAGECSRFDELSIKTGVHGILNVMNFLGMIRLKKAFHSTVASTIAKQSHWLRSSYSGLFKPSKQLGKVVKVGEKIAIIANPIGTEEYPIFSPLDGIIIGMTQMPMVHEGAALFNMASFKKLDMVEEHIDSLYEVYV
jgi:predicted deacylase